MASKNSRRQKRRHHKQTSRLVPMPPAVNGEGRFTFRYLRALWKSHPLKPTAILVIFAAIAVIAFFVILAVSKGFLSQFASNIVNENMAPNTAILLGAVSLSVLSGVIAIRGPFTERSGWAYRTFGVALPAIALTGWGTFCAISLGALGGAIILGYPVSQYVGAAAFRLFLFVWGLMLFLMLTVTTSDAPLYSIRRFKVVTRMLAGVMFLLLVGWFVVGAFYVA